MTRRSTTDAKPRAKRAHAEPEPREAMTEAWARLNPEPAPPPEPRITLDLKDDITEGERVLLQPYIDGAPVTEDVVERFELVRRHFKVA